ncbi:syndecan-4 isoform X2 [Scomber scombrus]|uniref:Syndecan n=1 Tax=Scomber scombrus TaxID=13677 RepID=A0AAV1Q3N6_SCOSC|nr:syndecan-4 [Scomber scombrus]
MLHLCCLVLLLSASVFSESVRETETWMPMKTTQTAALSTRDVESSGDSPNGSDFGFTDNDGEDDDEEDDDYYDSYDDDEDDEEYDGFSGSGDGAATETPERDIRPSVKPDSNSNKIPEMERPARPTVNELDVVKNSNEIPLLRNEPEQENPPNVLMSHAGEGSIFNKTEVLAAVIAGCAVGLMFAVLLTLFLIYRMKKKDEGSYDLGKKPIYKKAPTTEIYA